MKMEAKFNLLYEPWIRVLDKSGAVKETSLLDTLRNAHSFIQLAGELPTQDVAVLRLLLAVLYSVFTEYDSSGREVSLFDSDELDRWEELWELGQFPCEIIEKHLKQYEDRFYLFHPQTPFYQTADLSERKATEYPAAKLIGDLSESSNKLRLFSYRNGERKRSLTYSEAARWLLYLNGFDDTSAKPSVRGENMPSTGAGYLGKLGLVYAAGDNLFETLMLNFVLNQEDADGKAVWEDAVHSEERRRIPQPASRKELLTLQSRRLLLIEGNDDKSVTGYKLLGGDFFDAENAFVEHMTIWRKDKAGRLDNYKPKRHDPAKTLWRDFTSLTATEGDLNSKRPGVVDWIALLTMENILQGKQIWLRMASVKYGDKDFFVDDVFGDSVSVNSSLLSKMGKEWITRICDVLKDTETCVWHLKNFARAIDEALGGSNDRKKKRSLVEQAVSQAYFDMDIPFRRWLAGITPANDDVDEKMNEWLLQVRSQLLKQGRQMLEGAGEKAWIGTKNGFTALSLFENCVIKSTGGRRHGNEGTK